MTRLHGGMVGEIKKGPWTPREDHILSSYIQENGPGNWTSVPISAGLNRCGKSCRLRWSNYLRPDIKRGTFTVEEDRKIIQLQAVLGNKWAAIARYLSGRSENDVKNRWNVHLKKKLDGARGSHNDGGKHSGSGINATSSAPGQDSDSSKRLWERRLHANVHLAKKALSDALSLPHQAPFPRDDDRSLPSESTLPPTAPGLSSSLPLAIAPLLSSGLMSFKPPRGWNQNASQQQPMIPADDHQFRSQAAAQITRASNNSPTKPYAFNCENIALWVERWNKETSKSTLDSNFAHHSSLPSAVVDVRSSSSVLCRQHEDTMSPLGTSAFRSGETEDDRLPQVNMSVPFYHSSWPFF